MRESLFSDIPFAKKMPGFTVIVTFSALLLAFAAGRL